MKTLAPDRLLALRHSATIESIGSSTRIEGVKLSNVEIGRLLASLNQISFATCDEQEVAGYARLMERVFESWAGLSLNENHLERKIETTKNTKVHENQSVVLRLIKGCAGGKFD